MSNDAASAPDREPNARRRIALPIVLFALTCLSTFWAGSVAWSPTAQRIGDFYRGIGVFFENLPQGQALGALREAIGVARMDCEQGFIYMVAVLGILLIHEMGHFLMTLRYRIPASFPYFIPLPVIPFGTMGAVIGMEGSRATRRELFDVGIAGPLAGLAVALPITLAGVWYLPKEPAPGGSLCFQNPLLFQWLIAWLRPDYPTPGFLYLNQFNAFLMAGWMGMLLTGLNMLPVGQLDGGHVSYALLGTRAHGLARGLLVAAILFVIYDEAYLWVTMLVVVILLGTDHPPTADDDCRLGWTRRILGWAALTIPILCFPPRGIMSLGR